MRLIRQKWDQLLSISSAIQHIQLFLQGLTLLGISVAAIVSGVVLGFGAMLDQQPWYFVVAFVLFVFSTIVGGGVELRRLATPWPPRIVEESSATAMHALEEPSIEVESEGFKWKRGLYSGTKNIQIFPLCPQHKGVRLLFKYRQTPKGDWHWEQLQSVHRIRGVHPYSGDQMYDGRLFCSVEPGHELGWFPESITFGDAALRADTLMKHALEPRSR